MNSLFRRRDLRPPSGDCQSLTGDSWKVTQTFHISSWPHLQWQQWQRSDCREPTLFPVRVAPPPPPPAAPSFYIYSLEAVAGVYISAAAVSGAVSFPGGATAAAHVAPSLLRSHQVYPTAPGDDSVLGISVLVVPQNLLRGSQRRLWLLHC